eukprot:TRINITY_DN2319_c0_g1_i7.p1 TRINITY_DN2319_c0_g1~~TRINITY_DN2319_c0_g1_i7.p1  ORF type:complete len:508 (+),score=36.93 TRINITY_DN2319_c0_g1_i7:1300-2823(+)
MPSNKRQRRDTADIVTAHYDINAKTIIVFRGREGLSWFPVIALGSSYLITDLQPFTLSASSDMAVPHDRQPRQDALLVTAKTLVFQLDNTSHNTHNSNTHTDVVPLCTDATETLSDDTCTAADVDTIAKQLFSYTGRITRYLGHGVFELDERVKLYLSHRPVANQGRGLRIGCLIRVDNAHLVQTSACPNETNNWKQSFINFEGLGCCNYASIEILEYSKLCSPVITLRLRSQSPMYFLLSKVDIAAAAWLFQASVALQAKLRDAPDTVFGQKGVLASVVATVEPMRDMPKRDIWAEFFSHDVSCHMCPTHRSRPLPLLLTIKEFKSYMNDTFALPDSRINPYSILHTVVVSSQQIVPILLLGIVRSNQGGRMDLIDSTDNVPIDVIGDAHIIAQHSSAICIPRFTVVLLAHVHRNARKDPKGVLQRSMYVTFNPAHCSYIEADLQQCFDTPTTQPLAQQHLAITKSRITRGILHHPLVPRIPDPPGELHVWMYHGASTKYLCLLNR